jgi:hypothetical protein
VVKTIDDLCYTPSSNREICVGKKIESCHLSMCESHYQMAITVPRIAIELVGQHMVEQGETVSFFNLMSTLVITPEEFEKLPIEQQKIHFAVIKNLSQFETNGDHNHFIYRPIHPLSGGFSVYKEYIDRAFPRGERKYIADDSLSVANYRQLYYWITGACICGRRDFYWGQGDKHVEYICPHCWEETPFVKGVWAYY